MLSPLVQKKIYLYTLPTNDRLRIPLELPSHVKMYNNQTKTFWLSFSMIYHELPVHFKEAIIQGFDDKHIDIKVGDWNEPIRVLGDITINGCKLSVGSLLWYNEIEAYQSKISIREALFAEDKNFHFILMKN